MWLDEIRQYPTAVVRADFEANGDPLAIHESVLRSYAILAKTKELLRQGVPGKLVLELIEAMEETPGGA